MGITVEQRIRRLEDKIKEMKGCYNTAGSLVKMYVQHMGEQSVGGSSTLHSIRIKFTPTYGKGQRNIINLVPVIDSNSNIAAPFIVSPQDGSGDIIITIYNLVNTQKVDVIASGTSPGTFTRI